MKNFFNRHDIAIALSILAMTITASDYFSFEIDPVYFLGQDFKDVIAMFVVAVIAFIAGDIVEKLLHRPNSMEENDNGGER